MQRFGEKLRTLRKRQHMTLSELASSLGYVSHSYISAVEYGKKQPTVEFVLKVSRLFNVPADTLIKDELELDEDQV